MDCPHDLQSESGFIHASSAALMKAEQTTFRVLVVQLGAGHRGGATHPHVEFRGQQHSDWRCREIDPQRGPDLPTVSAGPNERAGFMLMPEIGASRPMSVSTRGPVAGVGWAAPLPPSMGLRRGFGSLRATKSDRLIVVRGAERESTVHRFTASPFVSPPAPIKCARPGGHDVDGS